MAFYVVYQINKKNYFSNFKDQFWCQTMYKTPNIYLKVIMMNFEDYFL